MPVTYLACTLTHSKLGYCIGITVLFSIVSDEETEGLFLVDFTQKIIDKKRENHADQDFQGKGYILLWSNMEVNVSLFIEEDVSDNTVLSFFF